MRFLILILIIISYKNINCNIFLSENDASNFLSDNSNNQNYESLLEQIYIERTACIDSNGNLNIISNLTENDTCEKYCKNYSCQTESINHCGDDTWTNYKGFCYKLFTKELSWFQSQAKCEELNGSLIKINDSATQAFINSFIKASQLSSEAFFIGLIRRNPEDSLVLNQYELQNYTDWSWADGELLKYTNWNINEPNNDGLVENCGELITYINNDDSKWNDIDCNVIRRKFICSKKAIYESNFNKDELVFDFIKFRELSEKNVIEFIDLLNKLTTKNASTFSQAEIISITNILIKITSLPYLPANTSNGFFGVINNILYASDDLFHSLTNVSNVLLKTIDTFMMKIKDSSSNEEQLDFKVKVPNIEASLNDVSIEESRSFGAFTDKQIINDNNESTLLTIQTNFKQKLLPRRDNGTNTSKYRLSVIYFKNKKLFQQGCFNESLNGECFRSNLSNTTGSIVSVTVSTFNNSIYEKDGNIIEYSIKNENENDYQDKLYWCGYWKFIDTNNSLNGQWSTEGCEYIGLIDGYHECKCNHTTHYALLFSPMSSSLQQTKTQIILLSILTYIGLGLSTVGLIMTLITYSCFKVLRQGTIHKCLVFLTTSLLFSNCLFISLSFIQPNVNLKICQITGLLFHYSILVSFMWMLSISIAQYMNFVKIIDNHIDSFVLKASILSFGLPIIIPLIIALLDLNLYYNRLQSICWLYGQTLFIGFVLPILAICIVNLAFFMSILQSIFRRPSTFKMSPNIRKNQIGASLCCFVLMGSTWIFGLTLLFNYKYKLINEIIFCVMNTTQGFLIFLFHVLLSKTKRDLWNKYIQKKKSIPSANTTTNSSIQSSKKFDSLKQHLKLKLSTGFALFSSGNKNQIIVTNNNNIILNNGTNASNSSTGQIVQQHHHFHHHVHHYTNDDSKSSLQRKPSSSITTTSVAENGIKALELPSMTNDSNSKS